jgi:hypothetical protein
VVKRRIFQLDAGSKIAAVGSWLMMIDLHTHSYYSDGVLSPTDLMARAHQHGVCAISLTDHDTTAGIAEAEQAAAISYVLLFYRFPPPLCAVGLLTVIVWPLVLLRLETLQGQALLVLGALSAPPMRGGLADGNCLAGCSAALGNTSGARIARSRSAFSWSFNFFLKRVLKL